MPGLKRVTVERWFLPLPPRPLVVFKGSGPWIINLHGLGEHEIIIRSPGEQAWALPLFLDTTGAAAWRGGCGPRAALQVLQA